MAIGSKVLRMQINVSDVDRGVYETLELKVAQHASESAPYLVARVLAYALEYTDGIAFTQGLAAADEPAVWVRDLTGQLLTWIDVGQPNASRLHKASKAAEQVAVYCPKQPGAWLSALAKERVHCTDRIALISLDRSTVGAIAESLDRRNAWELSRIEDMVYLESGDHAWELAVERLAWPS